MLRFDEQKTVTIRRIVTIRKNATFSINILFFFEIIDILSVERVLVVLCLLWLKNFVVYQGQEIDSDLRVDTDSKSKFEIAFLEFRYIGPILNYNLKLQVRMSSFELKFEIGAKLQKSRN